MNLKIEEVREPCQPNLLNMPKVVMEEVLKNLDCQSIFRLRKVCGNLRFSIDEIEPDLYLNSVKLELPSTTSASYLLRQKVFRGELLLGTRESRNEYIIGWLQKGIYKSAKISLDEPETLLKKRNLILHSLRIDLRVRIESTSENSDRKEEDDKKFKEFLKSVLENREKLLKTSTIQLRVNQISQVADILKCIDPKTLKCIFIQARNFNALRAVEMDFLELEELEQWKKAETLRISGNYILTPVESFASFETINVRVVKMSIEKLIDVKELFIRSPKLKTFTIESKETRERKDQILSIFGQFGSYTEKFKSPPGYHIRMNERHLKKISTWNWLKDVPGSTEKLQISLNVGWGNYIEFSKV